MFKKLLLVAAVSLMAVPQAWSMVNLGLVGTATKTSVKNNAMDMSPDGVGFGGGVLFGVSLMSMNELELGVLLTHRKVSETSFPAGVETKTSEDATTYEIPLLYRHWFIDWLSLGVGGYYAKYAKTDTSVKIGSGTATSRSAKFDGTDYGLTASLGIRVPLGKGRVGLWLDGRYLHGFKANKVREGEALAGLSFMLGK